MFLGDEDEPEASDYLASERAAFKAEGQELMGGEISAGLTCCEFFPMHSILTDFPTFSSPLYFFLITETPVKGIICNMTGVHRYAADKPNTLSFHLVLTHEVKAVRERAV